MPRRLTTKEFVERARAVHGERYDYSSVEYRNNYTKVTIVCPSHGPFDQAPSIHLQGHRCPECGSKKHSTESFIEKAMVVHGDRYDYSSTKYKGSHALVKIACREHGEFNQKATNHLSGMGCPDCWRKNRRAASLRAAHDAAESFVAKARKVHGRRYGYDAIDYKNSNTKVWIRCPIHGDFRQVPNSHLRGSGCPDCGNLATASKKRISFASFKRKAVQAHKDQYQYEKSSFKGIHKKAAIRCPSHGIFYQTPANHLNGQGCPTCSRAKRGEARTNRWLEGLVERFKEVHGDRYDYSKVTAVDSVSPVDVICGTHGSFPVRPSNHLTGHGCPKCAKENSPQFIDARIKNDEEFASRDGILYLLKVDHPLARKPFYKVGITSLGSLDIRFGNRTLYSGFELEPLDQLHGTMRRVWSLEKRIKQRIRADGAGITKFCDDFWHWTESFDWPNDPSLEELLCVK